jgi:putative transferase (TIGR04331 family)
MKKSLVLGAMPQGASPRDCLAAGPWCFAGREELFPGWESRFVFAPEPLRDPVRLELCAKQALATYAGALPALAEELCPASGLPLAYWETLLAPWGVDVARQIVERRARVSAMVELWGGLPLRVPLLPAKCSFSFATGHDFTLYGALGAAFNHWLLSRLLEAVWPGAWQKELLPPVSERHGYGKGRRGVKERLRQSARRLALRLPCPPLKGMSLLQSLRFSLALLHKSRGEDHSSPSGAVFEGSGPRCNLPLPVLPVFFAALPHSLRELRHPAKLRMTSAPRLRVACIRSYEDEKYLQRLAIWRGRGHRLMYAQHGAGYGQIRTGCLAPAVEYRQHAFITWGWQKHGGLRGNFIPLPYPQLARIAGRHRGGGEDILFVGTEMPLFPYRLDAWPTPLQVLEYRQAKRRFFTALRDDLRGRSLYRPYFSVPGTLRDADWLLPQFPQVRLCTGDLAGQLLSCRLLVLDHPGTTMLEALAANVPMVSYWSRPSWHFTRESEIMLDGLAGAGIWYPTPEAAARAVERIFDNPPLWWKSDSVQAARRRYCAEYAMTVRGSENRYWIETLARL